MLHFHSLETLKLRIEEKKMIFFLFPGNFHREPLIPGQLPSRAFELHAVPSIIDFKMVLKIQITSVHLDIEVSWRQYAMYVFFRSTKAIKANAVAVKREIIIAALWLLFSPITLILSSTLFFHSCIAPHFISWYRRATHYASPTCHYLPATLP